MAKLLTNTMAAVNAAALAESVLAAERAGLDPDAFLEVAAGSAGQLHGARASRAGPMFERDFDAALQARAHAQGRAPLPGRGGGARAWSCALGSLVEPLYARAAESGHAEEDFAAVIRAIE